MYEGDKGVQAVKEKILAEIEWRLQNPVGSSSLRNRSYYELTSLRDFVSALPDPPKQEGVKRWCIYEDGEPKSITKSYDAAASAASFSSSADVVVKHVEICEAKK